MILGAATVIPFWLNGRSGATATVGGNGASVQLVRLNHVTDTGMVRVEITADGSLNETSVEQFSRGREIIVRVRGARSLLRASYEINEPVARGIRTIAGVREGEPYVDVVITLGSGATIAQKKSFNRIIIGIASDFARLRRRPANAGSAELARRETKSTTPTVTSSSSGNVESSVNTSSSSESVAVKTVENATINQERAAQPSASAGEPVNIFRGRAIWSDLSLLNAALAHRSVSGNRSGLILMFQPQENQAQSTPEAAVWGFMPFSLYAPGADRGVWVPGTTAALRDEVGGRPLGPGYLRPSFLLGGAFSDNFFYRSTRGRNMGIFTFAPRLEYEIPGELRALRLAYEARLRHLSNGRWANGHVFDFDSRFDITRYVNLALRNHFVRSALDPREYDPAGEVYIVGDTFMRNDSGLRFQSWVSQRSRVAVDIGYNLIRWSKDHIAGAPLFINYDEFTTGVSFERDMTEQTTALASFSVGLTDSSAPLRPQFNNLHDHKRYTYEIGVRTQVAETSGLSLRVGYERRLFDEAPQVNNFNSLIFNLLYRTELTAKTIFELAGLRKMQVSSFNLEGGNARLVSTGGSMRLERVAGEALRVGLSVNYQQLGFPVAVVADSTASGGVFLGDFVGERRTDHLYGFSLDAAYRWSNLLNTRLSYSFMRRDSTLPVLTFNRNYASLIFEIGRRNERRGRPF